MKNEACETNTHTACGGSHVYIHIYTHTYVTQVQVLANVYTQLAGGGGAKKIDVNAVVTELGGLTEQYGQLFQVCVHVCMYACMHSSK